MRRRGRREGREREGGKTCRVCLGVRRVGESYWGRRKEEEREVELCRSFSVGRETDVL